eukprot:GHVQ01017744.1.p1 GENE.GHVQ01017744.1~~GHVQ01017744.1.p1  ORF type:complete len:151 (-),score=6.36 GHVQ01017744.1:136-588(-)
MEFFDACANKETMVSKSTLTKIQRQQAQDLEQEGLKKTQDTRQHPEPSWQNQEIMDLGYLDRLVHKPGLLDQGGSFPISVITNGYVLMNVRSDHPMMVWCVTLGIRRISDARTISWKQTPVGGGSGEDVPFTADNTSTRQMLIDKGVIAG